MTDDERMACIEAWSLGSWGDRLGEIVRICIAVERAERERCAVICDNGLLAHTCAAAIRAER